MGFESPFQLFLITLLTQIAASAAGLAEELCLYSSKITKIVLMQIHLHW